jgi:hypothetical protein
VIVYGTARGGVVRSSAGGDDEDSFRAQRSEHGSCLIGDRTRGQPAGGLG